MSELPAGWREVRLEDLVLSIRNGVFARRPNAENCGTPILRISAVRDGRVDLLDRRHVEGVDDEVIERFGISEGDLLFTRYNGSRALVGICGLVGPVHGTVLHPDKLIRVRPDRGRVDERFLALQMQSDQVRRFLEPRIRTTAGQSGIAGGDVRMIPVVLPPLDEQHRIVAVLEDHFSRLDAGSRYLAASRRRSTIMTGAHTVRTLLSSSADTRQNVIADVGPMPALKPDWRWSRLGDLCGVVGGVTKDAGKQHQAALVEVPYLRVANVQRGHLDLSVLKMIRVPEVKASALRLQPGDVLLNEGGDRDKLGRGWVWSGEIDDCIHQNHVFRARVRDGVIRPKLLSWWANTVGGEWCERHGRQSVNLASISLSRIRQMPVPVPPAWLQAGLEQEIDGLQDSASRVQRMTSELSRKTERLRQCLLSDAFARRL